MECQWEEQSHPLEDPLCSSRLASVKSFWEMHNASSDVQNSKILELSGVQSKAASLFVRIDTVTFVGLDEGVCQS
jgi:hypothetical protein